MSLFRENPVLSREIGLRLKLSRYSKANRAMIWLTLAGFLPLVYLATLRMLLAQISTRAARDFYEIWMVLIEMSTALLLPAVLIVGSISSEREKQTWNALLLARLTNGQIVLGKFLGALLLPTLLFVLFFPINVLCAWYAEIPLGIFVAAHAVLLTTGLFSATLGLVCSWAFRRTQIALVTTVLGLLLTALGGPLLLVVSEIIHSSRSILHTERFLPLWLNPYFVVGQLTRMPPISPELIVPTTVVFLTATLGAVGAGLLLVTVRLKLGPEELTH